MTGTAEYPYLVKDDATLYDVLTNKGGHVKFANDIQCFGEIKITKPVNLDFAGHTLSYNQTANKNAATYNGRRNWTVLNFFRGSAGSVVKNGKTIYTVASNVSNNTTARTIAVNDDVTLLIENMNMESAPCAVIVMDNTQTTINNCEILSGFDALKAIQYGPSTKTLLLNINNSKVVSTGLMGLLAHDSYLTANINGSEIIGYTSAICVKIGNIHVDETSKLHSTRKDFVHRKANNRLTTDVGWNDCDGSAVVLLTNLVYDDDAKTNELYLDIANWDNVTSASGVKVSVYDFKYTGNDPYTSYRGKNGHTVVDQFEEVEEKLSLVDGVRYFYYTRVNSSDNSGVLVERIEQSNGEYLYYNYSDRKYASLPTGDGTIITAGTEDYPYLVTDDETWYNALKGNSGYVKLLSDIVITGQAVVNHDVNIDLNNHTISYVQTKDIDTGLARPNHSILYFRAGNSVIKNGKIIYKVDDAKVTGSTYNSRTITVEGNAQLLIENMRIESAPAALRIYNNSKTTIKNSEIIGGWGTILSEGNSGPTAGETLLLVIDNSKIESRGLTAMYVATYATINVTNNSVIVGNTSAIYARMGIINVDATSTLESTREEFTIRSENRLTNYGAGYDDCDGSAIVLSLNHYYDDNAKTNALSLNVANWDNVTALSGVKVSVYQLADQDYYAEKREVEGNIVVDQSEEAIAKLSGLDGVRYFLYTKDVNDSSLNVLVEREI